MNWLLLLSFLPLVAMSQVLDNRVSQGFDMGCKICGEGPKGPAITTRILDGYTSSPKPWMVSFQIAQQDSNIEQCGGSLINKRWVLSAAECFCIKRSCKKVISSEKVSCLMGNENLSNATRVGVSSIVIYPSYDPDSKSHNLALVKLDRELDVSRNSPTQPICLPKSDFYTDMSTNNVRMKGFVAGWGHETEPVCTTGEYGPDPYTPCYPHSFYHQVGEENLLLEGCIDYLMSPSYENPLCTALQQQLKPKSLLTNGYTQTNIYEESGTMLTECFGGEPEQNFEYPYGWCPTCQLNAKPGMPGYCGSHALKDFSENPIVKATKNWGFCSKHCHNQTTLQVSISLTF